jgi:hypothetical protein
MPRLSRKKNKSAFLLLVLCGAFGTLPLQIYFPWWSIVPYAFMLGFVFRNKVSMPFLAGFIALFLQWSFVALLRDMENASILSLRIAALLSLPGGNVAVVALTGLMGGVLMGSIQLSGSLFGRIFRSESENSYY